jgi:peptidoglycan DL-endopeptidase CwlO
MAAPLPGRGGRRYGAVTMADRWRMARLLPRAALSTLLGGALALGVLAPAYASPGEVPDAGARPAPAGEVPLPDGSSSALAADRNGVEGPLAGEIAAVEAQIADLVGQLRTLETQLAEATDARERTDAAWQEAEQVRSDAEQVLTEIVEEAFRGAAAVLPQLTGVPLQSPTSNPLPVDTPLGGEAAARKLLQAQREAADAEAAYAAALEAELALDGRIRAYGTELAGLQAQLEDLRERNAAALAEQEAEEQRRAAEGSFPVQDTVAGLRAGERALQAVDYALRQLGKPYLWGAQGPDRYDCSGLMWDAYRSVGISLPRVAADQYRGTRTRPVARHALLPGDLVFFSTHPTDWRQIGHVGMYVGDGRMVHAPNSNDVVKVSPVWWSRYFGATRVVDPVEVDEPSPSPSPTPTPTTPPPTTPPPTTPPPTVSPTPPSDSPTTVTVPDLRTGMTADDAEQAIVDAGLVPDRGDPVTEGCTEPDQVVDQHPPAGESVAQGTTVTYHLCEPELLPDVTGSDRDAAVAELNNLTSAFQITVDYVLSEDHEPGYVIGIEPPAGTVADGVDEVTLTVVGVEVPDVRGMTVADALEVLEQADLDWQFRDNDNEEPVEPGDDEIVARQQPAPGEALALDGTVILYV